MSDTRLNLINDWLAEFFGDENFVISIASDDASFRRYFRIEGKNTRLIAMDAPPDKEDCRGFVNIAKLLRSHKIHAPKIIHSDLPRGFLLLEDFGKSTFLNAIQHSFDMKIYQTAIDTLIKMQAIDIKTAYNQALLGDEMQLLIDWYLPKNLTADNKHQLKKMFQLLVDNALNSPQVFVHRDYHSRNLMILNDHSLGVLDFQDALLGSHTYDLVSLLKDAYFKLQSQDLQTLLNYYYQQANITIDFAKFEKQFDLMGLQRHLKVLGIFTRLAVRDRKQQYLKNIPLVKKYALQMADKYSEFSPLKKLL